MKIEILRGFWMGTRKSIYSKHFIKIFQINKIINLQINNQINSAYVKYVCNHIHDIRIKFDNIAIIINTKSFSIIIGYLIIYGKMKYLHAKKALESKYGKIIFLHDYEKKLLNNL